MKIVNEDRNNNLECFDIRFGTCGFCKDISSCSTACHGSLYRTENSMCALLWLPCVSMTLKNYSSTSGMITVSCLDVWKM